MAVRFFNSGLNFTFGFSFPVLFGVTAPAVVVFVGAPGVCCPVPAFFAFRFLGEFARTADAAAAARVGVGGCDRFGLELLRMFTGAVDGLVVVMRCVAFFGGSLLSWGR